MSCGRNWTHPDHRTTHSGVPPSKVAPEATETGRQRHARRARASLGERLVHNAAHHRAQLEEYATMESKLVVWAEVHRALGLQAVESTGRTERE